MLDVRLELTPLTGRVLEARAYANFASRAYQSGNTREVMFPDQEALRNNVGGLLRIHMFIGFTILFF